MSNNAAIVSGVAGRYATALFELAEAQKSLNALAEELESLKGLIDDHDDLSRMLRNPLVDRAEQGRAMTAIVEKAGFSETIRNFVGVVARNGRLRALPDMIDAFRLLLAEHRGEVTAHVTSATKLEKAQLDALSRAIEKAAGRNAAIETRVDEDLIGGLTVRIGSRLIDQSLRTQIDQLQLAMKEGA